MSKVARDQRQSADGGLMDHPPRSELSVSTIAGSADTSMVWQIVASRRCSSMSTDSVTLTFIVGFTTRVSKPMRLAYTSYLPGASSRKLNLPSLLEVAAALAPVSLISDVDNYAGQTAPAGSRVTPLSAPVGGVWL